MVGEPLRVAELGGGGDAAEEDPPLGVEGPVLCLAQGAGRLLDHSLTTQLHHGACCFALSMLHHRKGAHSSILYGEV
jgi:hypothetical protein